ncbi:ribosome small subunit-dependent GTPase A [Fuchsiella alkaliacetigena]|uniref:ribosome small subunit-dependent GTPase A n=1 Tax=Fuchsiella alkaliacetigena TaxID=957042 RepID=UPI00200A5210|nr:ribosome small subunit-dependent GTPase A [Fuchsiella alkaliacetigena]MCK8823612.1 ribosome small subunit-dependent GTPase A [Fuchsiella alkaliacetigena]
MKQGRIIKAYAGYYYVLNPIEGEIYECSLRGRFRQEDLDFYVGDQVKFSPLAENEGVIEELLPRSVQLNRPAVANVEQVVVVFASKDPEFNYQLVDRFLLLAAAYELEILLCLNKVDLVSPAKAKSLMAPYEDIGYAVHYTDVKSKAGIADLKKDLAAQISVLAGPSGVGKSSLINLLNSEAQMLTQQLSEKIKRGKNTTKHVELIGLDNRGLVADTPGFSSLDISFIAARRLAYLFPELRERLANCKFNNCLHRHEPQCAVKDAVEQGDIYTHRYDNYLNFLAELEEE